MRIDETKLVAAFALLAEAFGPEPAQSAKQPVREPDPAPAQEPVPEPSNVTALPTGAMYRSPPTETVEKFAWAIPATVQQPVQQPVQELAPPTKEEVTAAATALWQATGDNSVIPDLLSRFGVTGLGALPADQYAKFLQNIKEATPDAG